jgi:SOS-response transcriptional repressor LexA
MWEGRIGAYMRRDGMATLRPRQQEILRFIERFLDENGYPPTVRDIQHGCDTTTCGR